MTKSVVVCVTVFVATGLIFISVIRSAVPERPASAVSPTSPVASSAAQTATPPVEAATTTPNLAVSSAASGTIDVSNWKTYSSAEVGTFKYPPDWNVSQDTSNGSALLVEIYPISGGIDDSEALVIWIGGPYGNQTMEETITFFKNSVSDFEQASTTVAGVAATKLEGIQNTQASGPRPYNGQKATWVLVPPSGISKPFYQFRGNDDSPVFDQILSTFAFATR